MPSSRRSKRPARPAAHRPSRARSRARPRRPAPAKKRPHKPSPPAPRARPAPKKAAPPAKAAGPKPPEVEALDVPLPGGRRHVLSLAFVRDGDEFLARLETDSGHITELKNRSLDQLLTLVAGELEDLLE